MIFNQHHAKVLALVVLLTLTGFSLTSCAKPRVSDQSGEPTLTETIANMGRTGKVLGCVFAPWHKECQKIRNEKAPHQSQEEYLEEVNEEWEKLDKSKSE